MITLLSKVAETVMASPTSSTAPSALEIAIEESIGAATSPAIELSIVSSLATNAVSVLANSPSASPIKVVSFEIKLSKFSM